MTNDATSPLPSPSTFHSAALWLGSCNLCIPHEKQLEDDTLVYGFCDAFFCVINKLINASLSLIKCEAYVFEKSAMKINRQLLFLQRGRGVKQGRVVAKMYLDSMLCYFYTNTPKRICNVNGYVSAKADANM